MSDRGGQAVVDMTSGLDSARNEQHETMRFTSDNLIDNRDMSFMNQRSRGMNLRVQSASLNEPIAGLSFAKKSDEQKSGAVKTSRSNPKRFFRLPGPFSFGTATPTSRTVSAQLLKWSLSQSVMFGFFSKKVF